MLSVIQTKQVNTITYKIINVVPTDNLQEE